MKPLGLPLCPGLVVYKSMVLPLNCGQECQMIWASDHAAPGTADQIRRLEAIQSVMTQNVKHVLVRKMAINQMTIHFKWEKHQNSVLTLQLKLKTSGQLKDIVTQRIKEHRKSPLKIV